tara:strand:- start:531 stop:824 length:294 start_codon:yes stop_codon:yes gene_type:complete
MRPNAQQINDIRKNEQTKLFNHIVKNFAFDDIESDTKGIGDYLIDEITEWENFYSAKEAATQAEKVLTLLRIEKSERLSKLLIALDKWIAEQQGQNT